MNKDKVWKYLTVGVATILMLSIFPEIRVLGLFIDAIGLDLLLITVEGYLVMVFAFIYHGQIRPLLAWLNERCKKVDPYYFVPKNAQLRFCPQLAFHSVPKLISASTIVLGASLIYA